MATIIVASLYWRHNVSILMWSRGALLQVYLVGGAVRDQLLGLPVHERDWVVVGSTVEAMLAQGFKPVGKDFPVFLHPETHEEYALARTERKVARGYRGFTFYAEADVSLEEDLQRRDLTINAIAQDLSGNLIDPYAGLQDIENKLLRHVSAAFQEDPVRILRLARFAARFPEFTVHVDTLQLAQQMVQAGEVDALVAERVWKECSRALVEVAAQRFFIVLQDTGAFSRLFPDWQLTEAQLLCLSGMPKDAGLAVRWAFLLAQQPLDWVRSISKRYRIPHALKQLSELVVRQHKFYPQLKQRAPEQWLALLQATDALRRPQQAKDFFMVCAYLYPDEDNLSYQKIFQDCVGALQQINIPELLSAQDKPLSGVAIKDCVQQAQLLVLVQVLE